ncbi:MAG: YqgE/AlgH family protein [Stellaceae bacterium]
MRPSARIWGRALLVLAIWLLPTVLTRAAAPDPPTIIAPAGQLLVAAPGIGDPRFDHTVIFLIQHDQHGAMGIVINRPLGTEKVSDLLDALGASGAGATGSVRLFAGGPVEPEIGFVLHSTDYHDPRTRVIAHRFAVTTDTDILKAIGADKGPKQRLIAFGYAGWGPGQLENELEHNDWYIAPASAELLFQINRNEVWQRAYDARRLRL